MFADSPKICFFCEDESASTAFSKVLNAPEKEETAWKEEYAKWAEENPTLTKVIIKIIKSYSQNYKKFIQNCLLNIARK